MEHTTVCPSFARQCRVSITCWAWLASNPEVGSSTKITLGLRSSSTAMASRFFSPPEMPRVLRSPMAVSAHFTSPRRARASSTTDCLISAVIDLGRRRVAASSNVSRTVI
mmetsp:Transcript_2973/g.5850  ORF Transcript_2973/g.5850 Transcript_2973/m.5850 type:complete len:110 (+) Transcript_2973:1540-1869(+)